jgi:hypothetical protein
MTEVSGVIAADYDSLVQQLQVIAPARLLL